MDSFSEMGIMGSSSKASEGKAMAVDDQPQPFRKGSVVEVSTEEEGFKDSWFEAKILALPKDGTKGKALIQYQRLITDEKSKEPLKESASLSFIRPLPPGPKPDQIFEVDDIVEAFHRDGWWVGVVSRVLDNHRYSVFFEEPGEELEFSRSNLRVHLDWVDGKWVKPQKLQEPKHKKVNVVEKLIANSFQKKRRKLQKCKRELSPPVEGKEDNALEIVAVDNLTEETEFSVDATLEESEQKKVNGVEKLITNSFQRKRRKLQKCKSQLSPPAEGKEDNALEIAVMDHLTEETEFSYHATLKDINQQKGHVISMRKKEDCTRARTKRKQPRLVYEINKPSSVPVGVPLAMFTEHTAKQVELSTVLGLEPGSQTAIKETITVACARDCNTKENEVVLAVKTFDVCHDVQPVSTCFEDTLSTLEPENISAVLMKGIESGLVPDGVVNQQNDVREKALEDRHPLLLKGNDSGSQIAILDVVSATDCKRKEDEVAFGRKDCNMCQDEQPLSLCYEEAQSTLQDTDPSLMNGKDSREKPLEIEMQSLSTGAMGNGELMEGQDFLLLKDSPVWKAVESMDVFQTMPQKPHFQPLLKAKEVCREGLAIGSMVTFAALVQKATKLKMGNPIESFNSILEALPELETLGFDVKSVRLRVNRLLFFKDKQERLLEKSKARASRVTEHSHKLTTLDAEIENIEKQMKSLAEKQALLIVERQIEKSKIAEVQEEEEGAARDIQRTEMDFESIATSPW